MDADELIDDYLAEHVDMVNGKKEGLGVSHRSKDGEETQELGRTLRALGHIRGARQPFYGH